MEYFDQTSGASAKLSWSSASVSKAIIPRSQLYPPLVSVTGTGLRGSYYNAVDLSGAVIVSRVDTNVNFNWLNASPAAGINTDNFSVRWSGLVQPLFSETYTFYTMTDDGVRLWVNGQQLVNDWTGHSPKENSGTITLVAGQKYNIVMEYFDQTSGASAMLSWSAPSVAKAIIPKSQLFLPLVQAAPLAAANNKIIAETLSAVVAPNPVMSGQQARVIINNAKAGWLNISLLDVNGKLVSTQQLNATTGTNTAVVNTTGLSKGFYVVRITEGTAIIAVKIVIQ